MNSGISFAVLSAVSDFRSDRSLLTAADWLQDAELPQAISSFCIFLSSFTEWCREPAAFLQFLLSGRERIPAYAYLRLYVQCR